MNKMLNNNLKIPAVNRINNLKLFKINHN